ncbi:MAG: oligosaccharyl transferase, archaeosortase A system-associated [Halobacteria archaeon]
MTDRSGIRVLDRYAPPVLLAAIFAFMAWLRSLPADVMIKPNAVFYSGNDPWYHMRMVQYVVRHFPNSPAFDPWSLFPFGTGRHSGFGGLFDQIIATFALILGAGDPSTYLTNVVGAYAPVLFGALTVVPVYFIVKSFTNRWTAVFSALLLSLFTGQFLQRTMVGNPDHQSAEALFGAIAVMGFIGAYNTALKEKPTVAHFKDRDFSGLKKPLITAVLGGVGIASYLMVWPPGVMVIFTFEVFVILQMIREHWEGNSTEYFTIGVSVSMITAGVINLAYADTLTLSSTSASMLQALVPFGVCLTAIYMHYLSRWFRNNDYEPSMYPVAIGVTIAVGLIGSMLVFPEGIEMLNRLLKRVYSFGLLKSQSALTVAELAPASVGNAWVAFGAMFFVAIAGGFVMLARVVYDNRPTELLMLLWAFTMFSAYFTMIRFGYYTALNVAILSAFLFYWIFTELLDLSMDDLRNYNLEGYQVIIIILMIIIVLPGNVVAMSAAQPSWDRAPHLGGYNAPWFEELEWMQNGTFDPEDAPAEMGQKLEYYGAYEPPKNMDFEYPEGEGLRGAYGVMSWWDYGHWITVKGKRIPDANPFQQGQRRASDFFVSESEERSSLILEALPSLKDKESANLSKSELRSIIGNQTDEQNDEDTRYIMIDDKMAAGKFNPIATWSRELHGNPGTYYSRESYKIGRQNKSVNLISTNEKYDNTTLSKLYFGDANGMENYRLVHETKTYSLIGTRINVGSGRRGRLNQLQSRARYNEQVLAGMTMKDATKLPEKQPIRLGQNNFLYNIRVEPAVKTFEKVEGAKIKGQTDKPNQNLVLIGNFRMQNTGRNFTYAQRTTSDSDGNFEVTVPYSTKGSVPVEDGGTDSAVESTAPYVVSVGNSIRKPQARGTVNVTEKDVLHGNEVKVELNQVSMPESGDNANISPGNESPVDTGTGEGTSTDQAENTTQTEETDNETETSSTDNGSTQTDSSGNGSTQTDSSGNESS